MKLIPNLDIARFLSQDACTASGVTMMTLTNWLRREPSPILMSDEQRKAHGVQVEEAMRPAGGTGGRHLWTLRRVIQIALTKRLVDLGIPPRAAGLAALRFTDLGTAVAGYSGDQIPPLRMPGQFFEHGATLLVVRSEDDAEVMNFLPGSESLDALFRYGEEPACAVVHVNAVVGSVHRKLNLSPATE